ncbi:MAG TPA: hypothetical protein P5204_05435 [Kiritimatiellia bacterium]|nr:hypothetical protein [Kiritimatiellia bacterium]
MDAPLGSLLRVCSLLNAHGAHYLVIGGYACILHGLVRTTEDVDVLIEESEENYLKVRDALAELPDHAARELTADDFAENVIIKVADAVEVDVSRRAWKVDYASAARAAQRRTIDGIEVPFLDIPHLILSKQTYREKDAADRVLLERLQDSR